MVLCGIAGLCTLKCRIALPLLFAGAILDTASLRELHCEPVRVCHLCKGAHKICEASCMFWNPEEACHAALGKAKIMRTRILRSPGPSRAEAAGYSEAAVGSLIVPSWLQRH